MIDEKMMALKRRYSVVGEDPGLIEALRLALAVSGTDIPVLITGETGTGKDVIPRIIHENSARKNGKFLAINCGAIPQGTVDSELFGHEKGSFTGAVEQRKGYFEEANKGTIFLDEIAELPLTVQAKILRVMQSGEFSRMGSSTVLKTDVRIIVATNVNLSHAVSQGKFRQDLLYRINSVTIKMPALRDRKDDVPLLFRNFVNEMSLKHSLPRVKLTPDAIELLKEYRWPGNIRQLRNIAEAVCTLETIGSSSDKVVDIDVPVVRKYIPLDETGQDIVIYDGGGHSSDNGIDSNAFAQLGAYVKNLHDKVDALAAELSALKNGAPVSHTLPVSDTVSEQGRQHASRHESRDAQVDEQQVDEQEWNDPQMPRTNKELSEENIRRVLAMCKNRKEAARLLGFSERTLYRKLKEMGIVK